MMRFHLGPVLAEFSNLNILRFILVEMDDDCQDSYSARFPWILRYGSQRNQLRTIPSSRLFSVLLYLHSFLAGSTLIQNLEPEYQTLECCWCNSSNSPCLPEGLDYRDHFQKQVDSELQFSHQGFRRTNFRRKSSEFLAMSAMRCYVLISFLSIYGLKLSPTSWFSLVLWEG